MRFYVFQQQGIDTLRPRQNGRHFPEDILKWIFLNENAWISLNISLKFVPKVRINNIPACVQIMACRRSGDKPLSEPMMMSVFTHICVTRPQWVKWLNRLISGHRLWYNINIVPISPITDVKIFYICAKLWSKSNGSGHEIAKPGNKTATVSWPDPNTLNMYLKFTINIYFRFIIFTYLNACLFANSSPSPPSVHAIRNCITAHIIAKLERDSWKSSEIICNFYEA